MNYIKYSTTDQRKGIEIGVNLLEYPPGELK